MRTLTTFCLALIASIALPLTTLAQPWQSSVQDHTITSTGFPEGTIKVDKKLTYIGSDKWVLYGVADCEIHVFAETDADKTLKRLIWVQFEGYLPDKPHTYNYDKEPFRTELSGHTYFDRVTFRKMDPAQKPRAGSDAERVLNMLESKGIKLSAEAANVRWVRLNEDRRKELLIIYVENLAPLNLTAADLADGGKAAADIETVRAGIRERAKALLTIKMK
ncbi:MAG: hypothetical protein JNM76_15140 [Betaproteobacteria bacterium]|nr:hypothetical protein [Betaproteobacteria bacterium]